MTKIIPLFPWIYGCALLHWIIFISNQKNIKTSNQQTCQTNSEHKKTVNNLLTGILLAFASISLIKYLFKIAFVRTRFNKYITFHMILIYAIITCFLNKSRHRVKRLVALYQSMLLCVNVTTSGTYGQTFILSTSSKTSSPAKPLTDFFTFHQLSPWSVGDGLSNIIVIYTKDILNVLSLW